MGDGRMSRWMDDGKKEGRKKGRKESKRALSFAPRIQSKFKENF
jgi:hypothetical protein